MNLSEAERLLFLATQSEFAYNKELPPGALAISDASTFRGYVLRGTDYGTIISLKGTANLRDVLVDLNAFHSPFLADYTAHAGFVEEFWEIWPMIRSLRVKLPIHVTGHSLGGALATLVGLALKKVNGVPSIVSTFGSPRVFSPSSAAGFDSMIQESNRVVHAYDCIPRVPKIDYKHVGGLIRIASDGSPMGLRHSLWAWLWELDKVVLSDLDGEGPDDHHIERYVGALSCLVSRLKGAAA